MFYILFVSLISFASNAQNESFKKDVKKLIEVLGVEQHIAKVREYKAMWTVPNLEKEYLENFDKTIPIFLKNIEEYYLSNYTHKEVRKLLEFYKSPLGKKMALNSAELKSVYSEANNKWEELLLEIVYKNKK